VIPKRWRIYVEAVSNLSLYSDPSMDSSLVASARRLLDADRARSRRKSAHTLPGRKAKKANREERTARVGAIREALLTRSGGRCEACKAQDGSEAHHLLSGPSRRSQEAPDTMIWACRGCHRNAHHDPLIFWRELHHGAVWDVLSPAARQAVTRRAEKATSLGTGPLPR
jgi:hypothetical protein